MSRRTQLKKMDNLEQKLTQRANNIREAAQKTRLNLRKIKPTWMIASGVLAGAVMGCLGIKRTYSFGLTCNRLAAPIKHMFLLGYNVGAEK